ncbi:MAG TPA: adenylate/guanylate cyclase domain-containing protein [Pyrinomonadaceae bacterium]
MEPLPIQISSAQERLRRTKAFSPALLQLLIEIDEMGEHSKRLIPELVETIKRGVYVPSSPLVDIISRLKSSELLGAALEQDGWSLSTFDRCKLFQAGFAQFQEGLLNELFEVYECDAEPRRSAIVEALAKSGTHDALEPLRVIEHLTVKANSEMADELRKDHGTQETAKPTRRGDYIPARQDFLQKVRQAIQSIESHPVSNHGVESFEVDHGIESSPSEEPEMAHVLFIDVVGFSKAAMTVQRRVQNELNETVEALAAVHNKVKDDSLLILPTGDGMAFVFFGGVTPHVNAAKELQTKLGKDNKIKLRMGLHSGPVHRVRDINGRPNITGAGINLAQRVMDCGDAGHVLLSSTVAGTLRELGDLEDFLEDLGQAEVKHGVAIHIFNLRGVGFGNPERPSKLSSASRHGRSVSSVEAQPSTQVQSNEAEHSLPNVRSAIRTEIETNLDLLQSIWNPVLDAYRRFQHADHIRQTLKADAVRRITLPGWNREKWQSLLPYAVQSLSNEEFKLVDRFYSRLTRLTELRNGESDRWRVEGELIISDLLAEGNPLGE